MTLATVARGAIFIATSLTLACASHPEPAPFFSFERIHKHWGNDPDLARLEPVVQASLEERFATPSSAVPDPLLETDVDVEKLPDPDGTTVGLATLNGAATVVPPKGRDAKLQPQVASLKERGQHALLDRGPNCDDACFQSTLKAITIPRKSATVNYFRPTYAFQLSSDVQTQNPFDRFERLSSLVLISACTSAPAANSATPLQDPLIPCVQDMASIQAATTHTGKDPKKLLQTAEAAALMRGTAKDADGRATQAVRIESLASIAESELTLVYGKLVEEDTSAFKVGANLAALPTAGGTGGASVEYQRTSKDTLTRDLAEKIVTTSVYRSAETALAPVAFWVDQRGSRDHKLRHSLAQNVTLELSDASEFAHATWAIDTSGGSPTLKRRGIRYPDPSLNLRAHVFTVGVVRQIEREGKWYSPSKGHTPNEDDDKVSRHVMTDYQRIDLPPFGPRLGSVNMSGLGALGGRILIYSPHRGGVPAEPDYFTSLAQAQTFVDQFTSATWKNPKRRGRGAEKHPHAEFLGAKVAVTGLGSARDVTDRFEDLYAYEY